MCCVIIYGTSDLMWRSNTYLFLAFAAPNDGYHSYLWPGRLFPLGDVVFIWPCDHLIGPTLMRTNVSTVTFCLPPAVETNFCMRPPPGPVKSTLCLHIWPPFFCALQQFHADIDPGAHRYKVAATCRGFSILSCTTEPTIWFHLIPTSGDLRDPTCTSCINWAQLVDAPASRLEPQSSNGASCPSVLPSTSDLFVVQWKRLRGLFLLHAVHYLIIFMTVLYYYYCTYPSSALGELIDVFCWNFVNFTIWVEFKCNIVFFLYVSWIKPQLGYSLSIGTIWIMCCSVLVFATSSVLFAPPPPTHLFSYLIWSHALCIRLRTHRCIF